VTGFSEACGVAVDPAGAVYVGDYGGGIHKFAPTANPPLNSDYTTTFSSVTQPCTLAAGAGASAGFLFAAKYNGPISKLDSSTGELKYEVSADSNTTVSVDPGTGHVYAATGSTVKEFDASGAGSATSASSVSLAGSAQGVAARASTSDVYVSRSGNSKVEVFGGTLVTFPDAVTSAAGANTGTRATLNGTVNPDGVELTECKFEWGKSSSVSFENTTPCAESNATIGVGTSPVAVHADLAGLKPQGTAYKFRLVVRNATTPAVNGSNQNFTTPDTVITAPPSALTPTSATLNGTVNPDGVAIGECVFEWGSPKGPGEEIQKYPESAPCVPGPGGITGTSPVAVHADLSGLHPGTTYVYRLKATYPTGPVFSQEGAVQTAGPAIAAGWSENVIRTEATLKAEIDPEGAATTYRFEYGPTEAYGSETPELAVGSDSSLHRVTQILEGLSPGTTYHYRAVATSGVAENTGPDRTFVTYQAFVANTDCPNQSFRSGSAASLADCRAYEMVTPVDKNGGEILRKEGIENYPFMQSSLDGDKLTYSAHWAFADSQSSMANNQYIASRGGGGWSTEGISPPQGLTITDPNLTGFETWQPFHAFTPDLSTAWVWNFSRTPLTPDGLAGYVNLYQRDNADGSYRALTNNGLFGPAPFNTFLGELILEGYSRDLSHVVFTAPAALTPDAPANTNSKLYDFYGGQIHLASVLPDGTPSDAHRAAAGTNGDVRDKGSLDRAVSEDGSHIFWTADATGNDGTQTGEIYARIDASTTVPVSESVPDGDHATFLTAAADGSKAIFATGLLFPSKAELYEFDLAGETATLIAGKAKGLAAATADLSHLYFVSEEDLAAGATAGERNLYLRHDGTVTFIATVDHLDTSANIVGSTGYDIAEQSAVRHPSFVSADGRRFVFQSVRSLTGYDNRDAETGEPAAEVYLYDADSDRLSCISCNPSGARPHGETISFAGFDLYREAASLPTASFTLNRPQPFSEDGNRVFFDAFDPLLPGDTNGVRDVYEWEAQGSGDCESVGGCISLVSTGKSATESAFVDAGADGDTVFFRTASSIDPRDPGLVDIYAARVNGGYPAPASPPECAGEACQNAPEPPRDPTPASASFRGAGNPPARKPRRSCRARSPHGAKKAKARRQVKRCKHAKRRAGR
jgi:hypothetical protein